MRRTADPLIPWSCYQGRGLFSRLLTRAPGGVAGNPGRFSVSPTSVKVRGVWFLSDLPFRLCAPNPGVWPLSSSNPVPGPEGQC